MMLRRPDRRMSVLRVVKGAAAALLAAAFALAGTFVAAAPSAEPAIWIVALNEEPPSLDPNFGVPTSATGSLISAHIYDVLVEYQAGREGSGYKAVPLLAQSYTVLNDTTWEFKLRRGVKFHNGDALTADDVKYSFEDYMAEGTLRPDVRAALERVEVIDPLTVRIITKHPFAGMIQVLSMSRILPKGYRSRIGKAAFNEKPIGSGPMKVVEWVKGQHLLFEANQDYWRGQVFPRRLLVRIIPDPTTRVSELLAGGVHIMAQPAAGQLEQLRTNPAVVLLTLREFGKGGRSMHYLINSMKKPFDDVRLRRAMNYAVNREAILKNVLEGHGELLHGPFSSGWQGYDPDLRPYPYDPARAKGLLAEAGYPNGFETELTTSSGVWLKDREIAEVIASQLGQVGVRVRIVPKESVKLFGDRFAGNFEGIILTPWATSADSSQMLSIHFSHTKFHAPDEKLNGLIDQQARTVDPARRLPVLRELGRYIHDQAYLLEIHTQDEFWAKRKTIDWEIYPYGDRNVMLFRLAPRR